MIYNNYFQKSFKKVMKRFLFGSFLLILIVILYTFNGTADNIWGLITLISAAPGAFYFMWGIVKIPAMLRAKTILKEEFPPDIDKSDIVLHADLSLPDIGTFIYKKHLFVLNKFWYYCVDLKDVSWLFVITLSSNVSSEDCLVVNTYYKKRYYFSIPELTAFGNYRWTSTAKAKEPVNYLFEYINLNYPQIDLGYSWDKDKVYLKNQSLIRKLFERSCRHDSFKKWADLNQKYNSLKIENVIQKKDT